MEFDGGNQTGPGSAAGRAFGQQQIENVKDVISGAVSTILTIYYFKSSYGI